jgi:hypothetical protein
MGKEAYPLIIDGKTFCGPVALARLAQRESPNTHASYRMDFKIPYLCIKQLACAGISMEA